MARGKISLACGIHCYPKFISFARQVSLLCNGHVYTGCNRRNGPDFGRVFLMLNYRKTPKHLYPKFNGYGDIGQRKVSTSLVSAYCTLSVTSYSAYLRNGPRLLQLHSHVIARSSRATLVKLECIVVGSQWTTMTHVRVFL